MSTVITISEFQKLTGIPDAVLGWLLARNKIPCSIDPRSGLMVDLDNLQSKEIISGLATAREEVFANEKRLLMEEVGALITAEFENVLAEAITAARSGVWKAAE